MQRLPTRGIAAPPGISTEDDALVPASGGQSAVPLLSYRPDGVSKGVGEGIGTPALYWVHGGGYVQGSASQGDRTGVAYARALDAVVVRREDLTGLPPTWSGVGTNDMFHDEDLEYARRLREAQVPCELSVVPGAFHGFDAGFGKTEVVRRFKQDQIDAPRPSLHPGTTQRESSPAGNCGSGSVWTGGASCSRCTTRPAPPLGAPERRPGPQAVPNGSAARCSARSETLSTGMSCSAANRSRAGRRSISPSGPATSQMTPASGSPASRHRSTAASV